MRDHGQYSNEVSYDGGKMFHDNARPDVVVSYLLFFFASVAPGHLGRRAVMRRKADYQTSLARLMYFVKERSEWSVIVCENTLGKREDVRQALGTGLPDLDGRLSYLSMSNNGGERNKGAGELIMLIEGMAHVGESAASYRMMSYMTGRRLMVDPYVLVRTESCQSQCLVGNPDFVTLNGTIREVDKGGVLNDMFFSMEPPLMARYASFAAVNFDNFGPKYGSEQLLYNFIKSEGVSADHLDALGFVRRDDASLRFRARNGLLGKRQFLAI